jgi:hypothetical protein
MTIIIDSTELRSTSRMPFVKGAQESPILESTTGADILVSPLSAPATTETLVRMHLDNQAVLVQRKSLRDFVSSIVDESINRSIARMIACGVGDQWRRIILVTGVFLPDELDGIVMVGEPVRHRAGKAFIKFSRVEEPPVSWKAFASIRRRILFRGACLLPLTCDEEIPGELHAMERDLIYLRGHPTKELLDLPQFPPDPPDPGDPLQEPIEIRDGRVVLAALRGVGPVRASAMWNAVRDWNRQNSPLDHGFTESDWEPKLSQALFWASCHDPKGYEFPHVDGWGPGTYGRVREQLGLGEGQDLMVGQMVVPGEGNEEKEE